MFDNSPSKEDEQDGSFDQSNFDLADNKEKCLLSFPIGRVLEGQASIKRFHDVIGNLLADYFNRSN